MSRRSFSTTGMSAVAVADATAMVNQQFMAWTGATAIQRTFFYEIYFAGQAAAAANCILCFGRDSTIGATPTITGSFFDAVLDPAAAAAALCTPYNNFVTTGPQRSATLGHLLQPDFNAFGGICRLQYDQIGAPQMVGNTASLGDMSLSAFTGSNTATISGQIIYETM